MFDGLAVIGLIAGAVQLFKEKTEKKIPASYWNNKDLMHKDKMNPNVSPQQIMKNLEKGKYYSPEVIPERYETPVKSIEDVKGYEHDVMKYGKEIADDNVKMGLYSFVLDIDEKDEKEEQPKIRDVERYKYDVERYGQEKADELAREGNYEYIYKNEYIETCLIELNNMLEEHQRQIQKQLQKEI